MKRALVPLKDLLEATLRNWTSVSDSLNAQTQAIQTVLDTRAWEAHCRSLPPSQWQENLRRGLDGLRNAARCPELILAVTGTTSSGKSTLANLLVGEAILPKRVQEMSQGIVDVRHDPNRRLTVEETIGATWAVGTWDSLSPEEIRDKLESIMDSYVQLPDRSGVEPPRFIVTWPTRLGARLAQLGLPEGTRMRILDIPGLKSIGDNANAAILREQARRSLCLVAYNAAETDELKQQALLTEIVDQVKDLGGSPARMLFVLNRIDVFLTDRDPETSEARFADRVTRQIRQRICEALVEYRDEARAIEPLALSSEPALLTIQAEAYQAEADPIHLATLEEEYRVLFKGQREALRSMARDPADWSEGQRQWFLEHARRQSRLADFEKRLGEHIVANLPELLLPDLVERVYLPAREAVAWMDALLTGYRHTEREQAEAAKERLEALFSKLTALREAVLEHLSPLRQVVGEQLEGDDDDILTDLANAGKDLDGRLGMDPEKCPIGPALSTILGEPLNRLNTYAYSSMEGYPASEARVHAVAENCGLPAALSQLRAGPYGAVWNSGAALRQPEAGQVRTALETLARALSGTASRLISLEATVQAERIGTHINRWLEALVEEMETGLNKELNLLQNEFHGLAGVFRGDFRPPSPKLPRVEFEYRPERWPYTETEYRTKTDYVRDWRFLWFRKKPVYTIVPFEVTKEDGVRVSKFGDLLEGFTSSGTTHHLRYAIGTWLDNVFSRFDESLQAQLEKGVSQYRQGLIQQIARIEDGTQVRLAKCDELIAEVRAKQSQVEAARRWRGNMVGVT